MTAHDSGGHDIMPTKAELLARARMTNVVRRAAPGPDVALAQVFDDITAISGPPPAAIAAAAGPYLELRLPTIHLLPTAVLQFLADWFAAQQFCPGPPPHYAYRFSKAPDLAALAPGRFRPEFGPVFYRGRLDGSARLLVVGQDPATDEQLANRSFVGRSGQRLQRFLEKAGLTRSYLILNTFHLGVKGQYDAELRALSRNPGPLLDWRNALFDHVKATNSIEAVLSVGRAAREAVYSWPGRSGLPHVQMWHPATPNAPETLQRWNTALTALVGHVAPDPGAAADLTPYGAAWGPADVAPVPRLDLPFGTPTRHGTGGVTHSTRNGSDVEILWMQ